MDASGRSCASAATVDDAMSDLDASAHGAPSGSVTPPVSGTPQQALEDLEAKRNKRLELNRKAAQESRRRKKVKVEELQRNVASLTRENDRLQTEHDRLSAELGRDDSSGEVLMYQAQNAALRLALVEEVERHSPP